ncbi:mechanosensitive ion channel family protein [Anaeromyxobacter oryzae]|uniref:mechanosensitive ion channel family protein n=1 Tax=Anaeromyxobacter oryzae TaxID=2918170 RepID=UPI0020BF2F1E|nr:mechanosensitive ion channel family protein [Anaeromyxobacter oryzae]
MSATRRVTLILLVLLLAGAGAGLFFTREREPREEAPGAPPAAGAGATPRSPPPQGGAAAPSTGAPAGRRQRLVDMRPLLTARQLSAFANTPEEQELSRQAERLADHALDLAFVVAIRDATENAPEQTPELKRLDETRAAAQAAQDAAQARVRELETKLAAAPERDREAVQDQLEVARAELELDKDELASAGDALQRAGGDPQARIRRLREVYDAAQKEPRPAVAAAPVAGPASSVVERFRAWSWHRDVHRQLSEARRDISERVERLAKRRVELTARMEREAAAREAAKASAARVASGAGADGAAGKEETVKALARYRDDQRRVAAVGRRLQDLQELADTYGAWMAVVAGHVRAALNRLLWGVLGLLALLSLGFVAGEVVDRFFRGVQREKLRVETLRTVARLAVNIITLLLALFVVFGVPGQATTVLGLAGAGLTVALKDFIVAFFGWFILMGRNGIRVGDWVEIKGVGGEVVEIGLFHTVLLETGSWNDAGHPTGRRVSFVNSFAIEGHYFNFSTSGQWMWDELRLLVPLGRDPYPVIDGVQKLVEHETEANAKLAETEWRKTASRYRVQTFSAVPGIHVVPTGNGIEVVVRYITRAHERHESRRRLYSAVLELMHGKRGGEAQTAGAGAGTGTDPGR